MLYICVNGNKKKCIQEKPINFFPQLYYLVEAFKHFFANFFLKTIIQNGILIMKIAQEY